MNMETTTIPKNVEDAEKEEGGNELETGEAKPSVENAEKTDIENEPIDFKKESSSLDSLLTDRVKTLEDKQTAFEGWKQKLTETYAFLGGQAPDLKYPDQKVIDDLSTEVENLNKKKQELEAGEQMEELLGELSLLPKSELTIIIETGKNSKGEEVKGKDGKKVKPEAAKSLAKLAFEGAKMITMAILTLVTAVIGGVSAGIYESAEGGE